MVQHLGQTATGADFGLTFKQCSKSIAVNGFLWLCLHYM